jgi:hypothetical protein
MLTVIKNKNFASHMSMCAYTVQFHFYCIFRKHDHFTVEEDIVFVYSLHKMSPFSGYLPKTAYIKMIDIWLIFAMSIPFCEVLLCTFIDNFREEGRNLQTIFKILSSQKRGGSRKGTSRFASTFVHNR